MTEGEQVPKHIQGSKLKEHFLGCKTFLVKCLELMKADKCKAITIIRQLKETSEISYMDRMIGQLINQEH